MQQKRTIKQLYKILWDTMHQMYVGDGLYLNINQIIIGDPYVDLDGSEEPPEYYEVWGTYGRDDKSSELDINFHHNFHLTYYSDFSDEFIAGMFFHIMDENETGEQ